MNAVAAIDDRDRQAVAEAAAALAAGELVAFPTETVYGLGARADDDTAVARIFAAKGRPADHPLIVHVADTKAARGFAAHWPAAADRLTAAFWPGPLTVIVPRKAGLAGASAGGQSSIGLRCPSHPLAQALLRAAAECGVPGVAAPSANRFGRISPTRVEHVRQELGADLVVLDGGPCELGIESTIIDCTRERPVLLRPGTLTRRAIEAVLAAPLGERDAQSPRASGTLEAHYAPRAAVRLMSAGMLRTALELLASTAPDSGAQNPALKLAVYSRLIPPAGSAAIHQAMPARADQTAHELFAVLRAFDDQRVSLIWVEEPPADPEWDGVRDRLARAAAA